MQTEFYNRLLNTCERRGHSLTARFETSDWCYQKSNTYKDFPDLVESCEEAGLHIYKKAMATPPRDADEALLLFDKLMKDINDDISEIIEASPYLQAAVDNLRAFLESTAKLHAEARKVFFGGVEDATNNKAKPLNTEEELDAAIKSLDGSIKTSGQRSPAGLRSGKAEKETNNDK